MGTLRLLFACIVMFAHFRYTHYHFTLTPRVIDEVAVQGFYICSGFLITLVLNEKYSSLWVFYSNRALRIFPVYWAALVLHVIVNWAVVDGYVPQQPSATDWQQASALWWSHEHPITLAERLTVIAVNLEIFGMNIIQFTRGDYSLYNFIYIRPAWTLELELMFYLIAPFIVRRWQIALGVMAASFAARFYFFPHEYPNNFWGLFSYRFFPFELAYFMLGALSYRVYRAVKLPPKYIVGSIVTIIVLTLVYDRLPFARPIYLLAVAACLPGIVTAGLKNPLDGFFGDLSYPLYLLHHLFILWVLPSAKLAIASTVILASLFVFFIDRPVDRWRQRRARASIEAAAGRVGEAQVAQVALAGDGAIDVDAGESRTAPP
jgi:peptidoglycan/LPS O-acetylase OafA/YrhL